MDSTRDRMIIFLRVKKIRIAESHNMICKGTRELLLDCGGQRSNSVGQPEHREQRSMGMMQTLDKKRERRKKYS